MATELITTNSAQISTYFKTLETHKTLLTTCTHLYKTITTHFSTFQQTLTLKSQTLDSQFESLNSQIQQTLDSISRRDASIPQLESSAAALIIEKNEFALSEMESDSKTEKDRDFIEMVGVYCRRMDCNGLLRYLVMKKREVMASRAEISSKMVADAVDVLTLVLNGVEEFVEMKEMKLGLADKRWACGVLIQGLFEYEDGYSELSVSGVKGVPASVAEKAWMVVEKWKGLVEMGAPEAVMFLQVVVVFGLKERFEDGYLKKLVIEFAAKKEMAKIAAALGFGGNIADVIEQLVMQGKEIEAIYFVCEFRLTEKFPPVQLLKSSMRNSRTDATAILKKEKYSEAARDEANTMELSSIKSIIKCVEDHNLESEFSLDSLRERIPKLEKAKADYNASSTSKPSNKRAHGSDGPRRGSGPDGNRRASGPDGNRRGSGPDGNRRGRGLSSSRPAKSGRFSNASPSLGHRNHSQSHHVPAARYPAVQYKYPSQSIYEGPPGISYSGYGGAHAQSPAPAPAPAPAPPQHYSFTSQEPLYGGQSAYTAYDYSSASAPNPPYQQ